MAEQAPSRTEAVAQPAEPAASRQSREHTWEPAVSDSDTASERMEVRAVVLDRRLRLDRQAPPSIGREQMVELDHLA